MGVGKFERFDGYRSPSMDIVGRVGFDFGDGLIGRTYFHGDGFNDYAVSVDKASDNLERALCNNKNIFSGADYILAIMWGEGEDVIVDAMKCHGINKEEWSKNQAWDGFILKNGIYLPGSRNVSCRHGMKVFGQEAFYHDAVSNFEQFMKIPPSVEILFSNPFLNK